MKALHRNHHSLRWMRANRKIASLTVFDYDVVLVNRLVQQRVPLLRVVGSRLMRRLMPCGRRKIDTDDLFKIAAPGLYQTLSVNADISSSVTVSGSMLTSMISRSTITSLAQKPKNLRFRLYDSSFGEKEGSFAN